MTDRIMTDELAETMATVDLEAGRRAFIKTLGLGTVGTALFGAAAGLPLPAEAQAALTVNGILNFALNLEYLEATFYSYAANGVDIPAADTTDSNGNPGVAPTGGQRANLTSPIVRAYAAELANEELRHVRALRNLISTQPRNTAFVARPAINIGSAFSAAATAAGVSGGASFSPYSGDGMFLLGSYIFEDVGVTAYNGAVASGILNNNALAYASGILAVEAYHAGIIRTALFALQNASAVTATQQISDLRSKLANNNVAGVDDIGIGRNATPSLSDVNAPNATQFISQTGGDAVAYQRTPQQVLNIVYGNTMGTPGLFFPNGVNTVPQPTAR